MRVRSQPFISSWVFSLVALLFSCLALAVAVLALVSSGPGETTATTDHEVVLPSVQGVSHPNKRDCDASLQSELAGPRVYSAGTAAKTIYAFQSQPRCSIEVWNPQIRTVGGAKGKSRRSNEEFFTDACLDLANTEQVIGHTTIPSTMLDLIAGNDPSVGQEFGEQIGPGYAKDSRGNVLVEFEPPYLPADGATCWLYVEQFDLWESETG